MSPLVRAAILLTIGLAIGAASSASLVNRLNRASAYPDGVMTVMGQQMKSLNKNIKANHCAPADLTTQLQTLRLLANNIEPAFEAMQSDAQFGRYASDLRAAADGALAAPLTSCPLASAAFDKIDKACDSCHRDYNQ